MNFPADFDLKRFDNCRLLVVGDLMIDEYVWGDVDRISPEAPVQVVAVNREDYTLGGSGNVVNNLAALGAAVSVLGVVGTGINAEQLLDKLADLGSDTRGIFKESGRPTTKKPVLLPNINRCCASTAKLSKKYRRTLSPRLYLWPKP